MVTERNWLDVYPWANWGGNANLPTFQEGQTFMPNELLLKEVRNGIRGHCCATLHSGVYPG
jgi:DNA topoisomerase IA